MKFDEIHEFDRSSDDVLNMFTNKDYFVRKYEGLGYTGVEVLDHQSDDRGFSIKVRYEAPSDAPVPGFAKKFLGQTSVVVQTDSWDREAKTGRLQAEIQGLPAKVHAEMSLRDNGDGCVNELDWTISCGIPLVGGKIERLVAEDIQSKGVRDLSLSQSLLAEY